MSVGEPDVCALRMSNHHQPRPPLDPDEWQLIITDPVTGYLVDDHIVALVDQAGPDPQPILHIEATHISTKIAMRLTLRVPRAMVPGLAGAFGVMRDELIERGKL
jgi:hypothetical protein